MVEKVHVPPFKTQGIKTKLVPLIRENACIGDATVWIEPFMGSGVVGLNVAPKKAVFSDLNPHVIHFYNQLKSNAITSRVVTEYLREQGVLLSEKGGEYYYHVRERFNKEKDPLDFLFLNRSCFNGIVHFNKNNGFNVPYGHKPLRFSKAYITKITNQVRHFERKIKENDWTFVCQSFEDAIAVADENSFVYCDPPYIGRHVDYYDSWDEACEKKLHGCLEKTRARYMLSTWDFNQHRKNQYVSLIWNSCHKITKEHFYFIGAREENRGAMTEALLTNYSITDQTRNVPKNHFEFEQPAFQFQPKAVQ